VVEDGVQSEVEIVTGEYEVPGGVVWVHAPHCDYDPAREHARAEGKVDLAELDLPAAQRSPAFRRVVRDLSRRLQRNRQQQRRPPRAVRTVRTTATRHARAPHRQRGHSSSSSCSASHGGEPPGPPGGDDPPAPAKSADGHRPSRNRDRPDLDVARPRRFDECAASPLPWIFRAAADFGRRGWRAVAGLEADEVAAVLDVVAEAAPARLGEQA
jgi:hypothetical protein